MIIRSSGSERSSSISVNLLTGDARTAPDQKQSLERSRSKVTNRRKV